MHHVLKWGHGLKEQGDLGTAPHILLISRLRRLIATSVVVSIRLDNGCEKDLQTAKEACKVSSDYQR